MSSSAVSTSTVVKPSSGTLNQVSITVPGTGSSSVNVYDGTSASGKLIWSGDGLVEIVDPDLGITFQKGLYVALAGSTKPTVEVIYDE